MQLPRRLSLLTIGLTIVFTTRFAGASGLEATRLSLPKGPASIEGLGRNFVPSLSSGTSSYGIDIAVPPAVAGFGPKLSLEYDSGSGVSELGMGWRLGGLPSVRRRTENGLPRFDSNDAFEVTGLGVTSDLLEVAENTFRPEQEGGSFIRAKRSQDGARWEVREKSGLTYRFGGEGCTESEDGKVATWLLCERLDLHGHSIKYAWDTSGGAGLLQSITWNTRSESSTLTVKLTYEDRPDVIERFSAGIKQLLDKRVARIDVLRGKDAVRSYTLTYDQRDSHSRLVKVGMTGADGVTAMPELRFEYTAMSLVAAGQVVTMASPPGRSTTDKDVTLADLNGDSLPDLLVGKAGAFISYVNHDGKNWKSASTWSAGNSPSVSLSSTGVQLADMDGDGAIDLVIKSGTTDFRYLPAIDDQRFGAAVAISTVPNVTFEDPDVRLADMDGDRRTDVVITTAAGIAIGYNLNGKDWTEPKMVGVVDARQTLRFSDGHTQLCDVNGDRVQDLCYLRSGGLIYYLGRGRGIFEAVREATGVPDFDISSPWQLIDLNGDGWVDLVHVGVNQVDFALATSASAFGTPSSITGTPTKSTTTQVEFADMNGSGTTDIVWIDVTASSDKAWQYLELFPSGRGGLLKAIDNGLGTVTRIAYAPAALGAAKARDNGTPWSTRMNVGMPVVSEMRLESALGDPAIVTDYEHNNGTWDPSERTFAGFGEGIQTENGDSSTPTLVTDTTFDSGVTTRVMRGQPLTSEQRDAAGYIFSRTTNGYATRDLETAIDGRRVHYAFKSSEQVEHIEGKDTASERITLTEWEQDQYGNVTKESKWGEVVGGDRLGGNDEAITIRSFANNTDDWLLGYLVSEELQDAKGNRVRLSRRYYDGEALVGLDLGQVTRGDLTRVKSWIAGGDFADEVANQFDADGNVIAGHDGRGYLVEYDYDSDSHTFVTAERHSFDSTGFLEWRAQYDAKFGVITQLTTPSGSVTLLGYDALARIVAIARPGDTLGKPTTKFTYRFGNPTSLVITEERERSGEDGVLLRYAYTDGFSRPRAIFNEGSTKGQWILSQLSQLDARGQASFAAYPTLETSADYPASLGSRTGTATLRDALGREVSTRHPDGAQSQRSYVALGINAYDENETDVSSPHFGKFVNQQQDGLGRLVRVTEQGNILTGIYSYDAAGSLLAFTDALGHSRAYAYDGRGRRVKTVDPNAGTWTFEYSDGNDLTRRIDPTGSTIRFVVDGLGRALEEWHQLAGQDEKKSVELHYDAPSKEHPELASARGTLSWLTDEAGAEYFGYDARGRVVDTIRRWSDGTEHHSWTDYDAHDRVIRRGFPDSSYLSLGYDSRGLLEGVGPFVTHIDWTPEGSISGYHLGNGLDESRSYDQRRRLYELTATDSAGAAVRSLKYTLDAASHVTRVTDLRPNVSANEDLTAEFGLDDRYRLLSAKYKTGTTQWTLDDVAKILSVKSDWADPNLNVTHVYGESGAGPDRLTHRGTDTLSYDAAGRLVDDEARSLSWDAKGRLSSVKRGDIEESYLYGHDDERLIKTTVSGGETETVRYIDKDIEERNGKLVRYVFINGQRVVRLDAADAGTRTAPVTTTAAASAALPLVREWFKWRAVPLWAWTGLAVACCALMMAAMARSIMGRRFLALAASSTALAAFSASIIFSACGSSTLRPQTFRDRSVEITKVPASAEFYLGDIQGSSVTVVDSTGHVKSRSSYHPYGQARFQTASHSDPFGFVANEEDRGSGLSDFIARSYRPEAGTFLSVDPVALFSPESIIGRPSQAYAYTYGEGNPIDNADPEGKQSQPYQMTGEPKNSAEYISAKAHAVAETLKGAWGELVFHMFSQPPVIPYALPQIQMQEAEKAVERGRAAEKTFGFANVSPEGRIAGAALVTIAEVVIVGSLGHAGDRTVSAASRITRTAPAKGVPGLSVIKDGNTIWAKVAGDPKAFARIIQDPGGLFVTDIFHGAQGAGSGSQILTAGLRKGGLESGQRLVFKGIINPETLETYRNGGDAADSLLGRLGARSLRQMGLEASSYEFQMVRGKLDLAIGVK